MTDPTPLSPAAQAVLDAWDSVLDPDPDGLTYLTRDPEREALAAALRAAADQVVPEEDGSDTEEWIGQSAWFQANYRTRFTLLAIAAELEGAR